jgi:anaerobic selenocysteine-containing dehydrogenase
VRAGLSRLELVVVVDQFLTDTTREADYVLPAKNLFEQEDLVTSYWHPYLQRRAKIFEPPGQVKPETEIWRLLCERFGFDTSWFPTDTQPLLRGLLPAGAGEIFDRLADEPLDLSNLGDVAFAHLRFPTPSGKVEFASDEAARLWQVDRVPDYPGSDESEADAGRFPLQLLSCKTRDRIHSQFGNLDWIRDVERPHRLEMHPDDALARGLTDGQQVVASSEHGRITVALRISNGLRRGVVHLLEGRSREEDPQVNLLTGEGVTDMGHGATFYECAVEVRSA